MAEFINHASTSPSPHQHPATFLLRPSFCQIICSSRYCTLLGIGNNVSSSWISWRTAEYINGGEKTILVLVTHISNLFFFCRQNCLRGYRSSIPQRPLCDGDFRIPCGQKQHSECGVHGHCRWWAESWWVKGIRIEIIMGIKLCEKGLGKWWYHPAVCLMEFGEDYGKQWIY